ILAHDHPVEVTGLAERAADTGQKACRPYVGVLIEALADREPQSPQGDVVRNVGRANGAEIDRVKQAQLLEAVGRPHPAVLAVIVRPPIEWHHLELEPVAAGAGVENLKPSHDHLGPDSVARNGPDLMRSHAPPRFCARMDMEGAPQPRILIQTFT